MSEYLIRGFATEKLIIKNIGFDLEKRIATAKVDVETDFVNYYEGGKDNSFHWSVITAYRAACQLAIAYICTDLRKEKKDIGEMMQISSSTTTAAPIKQVQDVPVRIEFPKYIKRDKRLLGEMIYDVANRAFYGNVRFAVDLDNNEV